MKNLLMLFAMAVLAGCATTTQRGFDYDRDVEFTQYRTFNWLPKKTDDAKDVVVDDSFLDKRFRSAIVDELEDLTLQTSGNRPDLYISYQVVVRDNDERVITTTDHFHQPYHRGFHFTGGLTLRSYRSNGGYQDARVTIDIIDAENRTLLWRGWTAVTVTGPTMSKEKVREAVKVILANFPPKAVR